MGLYEYLVLGLLGVNLLVTTYVAWRAPQVLARPFINALGQKEGELIVLRATLQQVAQQQQAVVQAAQAAREAEKPERVAKNK